MQRRLATLLVLSLLAACSGGGGSSASDTAALLQAATNGVQVSMPILGCVLPRIAAAASSGLGDRDYIAVALEPAPV
jgi:hypothetical protein